jgi:hypothetical protein
MGANGGREDVFGDGGCPRVVGECAKFVRGRGLGPEGLVVWVLFCCYGCSCLLTDCRY